MGESEEGDGEKMEEEKHKGRKEEFGDFQPLQLYEGFKKRVLQQLLSIVVENLNGESDEMLKMKGNPPYL